MIICKTPFRVSFFGGGTDLPDWLENNHGQVISTSINKYGYILLRESDNVSKYMYSVRYYLNEKANSIDKIRHPVVRECLSYFKVKSKTLHITYDGDLPSRSGLGSSSSFSVGLINAIFKLKRDKLSKKQLAKTAINFEHNVLKETVGYQDQIATSYGGFNHIYFRNEDFKVSPIKINSWKKLLLNEHLTICLIDGKRSATNIEKKKIKKINKNYSIYNEIFDLTRQAKNVLNSNKYNSINEFGHLLNEYWDLKKSLDVSVSNDKINFYQKQFLNNGAYGSKLMGAGSSGFILILSDNTVRKKLVKKFPMLNFIKVNGENNGSELIYST